LHNLSYAFHKQVPSGGAQTIASAGMKHGDMAYVKHLDSGASVSVNFSTIKSLIKNTKFSHFRHQLGHRRLVK
jgi:hypothetical protein